MVNVWLETFGLLPDEILSDILGQSCERPFDVVVLSLVCKRFATALQDNDLLWKRFAEQRWVHVNQHVPVLSWKQYYKSRYVFVAAAFS